MKLRELGVAEDVFSVEDQCVSQRYLFKISYILVQLSVSGSKLAILGINIINIINIILLLIFRKTVGRSRPLTN